MNRSNYGIIAVAVVLLGAAVYAVITGESAFDGRHVTVFGQITGVLVPVVMILVFSGVLRRDR